MIRLEQDKREGRYYDGLHFDDDADALESGHWYVVYIGMPDDAESSEELDVMGRDRSNAREVAIAAIKRDYQDGLTIRYMAIA